MSTSWIKHILSLFLFFAVVHTGHSYAVDVKASMDSVNLKMGNITTLHLTVSQPKGVKGEFPLLSQFRQDGIIPLCGDSVELRAPSKIDTVDDGRNLKITFQVPMQAFDSGYYRLPDFIYVIGKDSVRSNRLSFKVYPVVAEADTPPYDYASVSDPENPSIFDAIPDWIIDYWWIFLIIALAVWAYIYAMKRYRREGSLLPKKPEPTPYEEAVSSLESLKEKKLWQQGMEKEYFTELTEILRRYLYRRFGINAMEMTSRQILASLRQNEDTVDKRAYFRQILDMADFVKFAKVRPLPDDNVLAFDNALRFVEETKPVVTADDNSQNIQSAATLKADNKKGGEK